MLQDVTECYSGIEIIQNSGLYRLRNNTEKTENGRVSYPLDHIPNFIKSSRGSSPKNIILV